MQMAPTCDDGGYMTNVCGVTALPVVDLRADPDEVVVIAQTTSRFAKVRRPAA